MILIFTKLMKNENINRSSIWNLVWFPHKLTIEILNNPVENVNVKPLHLFL